ncbi:ATP-dependent DNA ligase [Streptomyces sp. PSKA28]|uniref:ATP-dependent DNA ligase n=2 Tax=Streptomyces TaxID=1883 RepID=A0A7W0DKM0_9ACTN|nr:ATP-dependent DNA ligase [Streptomyces himalayensis subsp. himalayensis]
MVFEPKYDGFRMLVFAQPGGEVFLQSRSGRDLTGSFPEIADAAAALGEDVVIDGEAVIHTGSRLDFGALQQRLNTRPPALSRLVRAHPAHLVAFDLLQHAGTEMLTWPYRERRAALQSLFQGHGLAAPWALTPSTTDRAQAEKWLAEWSAVGVEGVVVKSLTQPYQPGRRGWLKYRARHTAEAIVGAVTGSLARPQSALLGRYTSDGHFLMVARSTPLSARTRAELSGLLSPAGADHPWRDVQFSTHWGSREVLDITPVAPQIVAEFHADSAIDHGRWRHPVRVHRLRIDVTPDDVPLHSEQAVTDPSGKADPPEHRPPEGRLTAG